MEGSPTCITVHTVSFISLLFYHLVLFYQLYFSKLYSVNLLGDIIFLFFELFFPLREVLTNFLDIIMLTIDICIIFFHQVYALCGLAHPSPLL